MIPILINLCLAGLKFFAGSICGLTSVMTDATNNLMDAVTSAITELGAKFSAIPGGRKHKNGHGRIEWLVAIAVSSSIVVVGWELLMQSVEEIRNPSEASFSIVALIILVISVATKIFLYFFNISKSKEHNSQVYKAAALDCISDAVSTAVVLFSFIMQTITGLHLDGYCGLLVSLFIIYNGFKSFADTSKRIMGEEPDEDAINRLRKYILSYNEAVIEKRVDVQIMDYGYERFGALVNVVPKQGRTDEEVLDDITGLRSGIFREFGYIATIQPMVPVDRQTESNMRRELEQYLDKLPYSVKMAEETTFNRSGSRIQIILYAEVPFEEGKFEKEIVSEIKKFAEGKAVELVVKLGIVSHLHKDRHLPPHRQGHSLHGT